MLLIVHNLPKEITSLDVRQLIQEQCGLREVILDNLLDEGPGKRITVGLAEEEDAAILMQKLNGLHYKNCQLYVEDIRKKKTSAPSFPILIPAGLQPQTSKSWIQYPVLKTTPLVNQNNLPYYMTQDSSNTTFGRPTQNTPKNTSIFNRNCQYPPNATVQIPKTNNVWEFPLTLSNTNKNQAAIDSPSFESYQNDRDKQGDRRDNTTQYNWRENKSPPSKRHENFGNFSHRESRFGDNHSKRNKSREVSRRRDDDRSPPRGRNLFRESKKDDRRDDFDSSGPSRSNRWNPPDRGTYENERRDREQNSIFGRQREGVFDQHERRNDQKRNYEQRNCNPRENVLRRDRPSTNIFETTTFSSNPESSVFTKSNRSIFNQIIGSRAFGETSQNKVYIPSPKLDTSKSKVYFPAPKRARLEPPPQYFGNKKYINPNAPTTKTIDMQKMLTRHTNWRSQSASLLAKEVLKNASTSKIDSSIFKTVFKKLRECIMARLDVIMGDKIANNLDEILCGYRTKFDNRDDIAFFKAVMEKVERENEENADEVTGANVNKEKTQQNQESLNLKIQEPTFVVNPYSAPRSELKMKPNLAATAKPKVLISQNRPKIPFVKDPMTMPRLPKYPNNEFQKTALLELEEGFYTMEPEFEKAVDEEVDKLVDLYVEACEPSSNKVEDNIRNKIITSTADEFKKIIKLHVTKRVLNVTEGLTVRIFSIPKPPPKAALDAFLKKHGAISLKKSDTSRMFVANCDSYESYDRLLALGTASFGSVTIYIKPFHFLGPVTKKNKKLNQPIGDAGEDFTKDVDESKIDLTNDLMTEDPDVMLIENDRTEVVVIRDDLDKSINSITSDQVNVNNDEVLKINDLKALQSNDKVGDSNDKVDDSSVKVDDCSDKVDDSSVKVDDSSDKVDDSNDKIVASNIKNPASNLRVDDSSVKVKIFNENVNSSNEKVDSCDAKINTPNEKVKNSTEEVNSSNDKFEDSRGKVPNSQSKEQIDTCESNITQSLDDILNEVGEILEDDLEDF